jgi:hypothetical protein
MADLAASLAAAHRACRALLRHALGSPPLARLLLPRLTAAEPGLLSPASELASEISRVLNRSSDADSALEAASLLWRHSEADGALRAELAAALRARRPGSLVEWYWLHQTLGDGAQVLNLGPAYHPILQASKQEGVLVPSRFSPSTAGPPSGGLGEGGSVRRSAPRRLAGCV